MSRLIESMENRVLLSVTPAQLQADAQALVTATSASNAAFNAVRSAEFGLIKSVAANLKHNGGLIGDVVGSALVATLTGAGKTGYTHIQTSQKVLTAKARTTARQSVARGKALLRKSSDTTLQTDVQNLINQLNTAVPDAFSTLQTVLQDAGTAIESAFSAIVAALPGISSEVQSVAQTVLQKTQQFDAALAAIPTAVSQLAADLSSITASQGAAAIAHPHSS